MTSLALNNWAQVDKSALSGALMSDDLQTLYDLCSNYILLMDCHSGITKTCLFKIYCKFYHKKKEENFQRKNSNIFHFSAQNIDCGYSLELPCRGGSNEYPQSMFLSRNNKNNVYPYKPQFYYIKVGFKGVKII